MRSSVNIKMLMRVLANYAMAMAMANLTPMAPSSTRSYHPNKYQPIPTRIQLYRYSYFPCTVAWWNTLPGSILSSPSYKVFNQGSSSSSQTLSVMVHFTCTCILAHLHTFTAHVQLVSSALHPNLRTMLSTA